MRILYGVTGGGIGHATRSHAVITYLLSRGHVVRVLAADEAYEMLRTSLPDVVRTRALSLSSLEQGGIDLASMIVRNVENLPAILSANMPAWRDAERFDPQVVFSDFEPFVHLLGLRMGLPVVALDNLQIMARCEHDPAFVGRWSVAFDLYRRFIEIKTAGAWRYVIPTFFERPIRAAYAATTTLIPPVIRRSVQHARAWNAGHVLVYQSLAKGRGWLDTLKRATRYRFVVYGMGRSGVEGNCTIMPQDPARFVADLASASAVIATSGASLTGECICLGKPLLAVPIAEHVEQAMNAHYLEQIGRGAWVPSLDLDSLERFLDDASLYEDPERTACDNNATLHATLDALLS